MHCSFSLCLYQYARLQPAYSLQQQLALFIHYGYLGEHLARTRAIYNERRRLCTEYLQQHGADLLNIIPSVSGMNSLVQIKHSMDFAKLNTALKLAGFGCMLYKMRCPDTDKPDIYLVLGHALVGESSLELTLSQLLTVLRHLSGTQAT